MTLSRAAHNGAGFAVLAINTTTRGNDTRIVEIGIVLLDATGLIERTWDTLINPGSNLEQCAFDDVSAHDLQGAPEFLEIAAELITVLNNRVLVAHNAHSEVHTLVAEFENLGIVFPNFLDVLCTRQLGQDVLNQGDKDQLVAAFNLYTPSTRTALHDAQTTAALFLSLAHHSPKHLPSAHPAYFDEQVQQVIGELPQRRRFSRNDRGGLHDRRSWLLRLNAVDNLQLEPQLEQYLAVLHLTLADGALCFEEILLLEQVALRGSLQVDDLDALHELYVHRLIIDAWADGTITDQERAWILQICEILTIATEPMELLMITPHTTPDTMLENAHQPQLEEK
ncbi:3'-5' exonuclease [Corynebacterium felinum]|uniref:DNA polymerase-3 subunit epsilon n=1 Tax=Corynebacterium felinum TaxID=131318 RepID=A0ABU2B4M4_9CORY|nr:3'-5' exonuclease [Corynebacterium felinum]MDF5820619.1 3'-5' exonuclease [Corynebacterium felinum]MDR7353558.1 DNA polymerase-3 subunit epsilon [Corynebacterium felinum]WJY95739.1 DNA polymerase III subunit epsilon [Corynebacterium felinum]